LSEDTLSKAELHENPLVPNKKLRQMYIAMAEARAFDEHLALIQKKIKPRRRLASTRGQEACRVSTAIDLVPGDLVSDSQVGVVMSLLAGTKVSSLLQRVATLNAGTKEKVTPTKTGALERQLPWVEDTGDRLRMAIGAAQAFKTLNRGSVVIAYVRRDALAKREWRPILELASKLDLPIIFVVLPGASKKNDDLANLIQKARSWGMPGIPVEASDAVAIYRVAQESLGRVRADGGPVLIECRVHPKLPNGEKPETDPLLQMKSFLLSRKVVTEAWLNHAADGLRRRLGASEGSTRT
jgi:TPP-dependent pyruvate/acetoin dehydrogenase alpha subunit